MKRQVFKSTLLLALCLIIFNCSSSSDDCEVIACVNGGVFSDCACDCPQGYTGTDCSQQVEPNKITISKVNLRLFPLTKPNNDSWDAPLSNPEAYPDVYFQIIRGSSNIIYDSPTFIENADLTKDYVFTLDTPIDITNYDMSFIISLFDYDEIGDDENMASEAFFIYEDDNDFPNTLTILDSNQPIAVDLELSYEF